MYSYQKVMIEEDNMEPIKVDDADERKGEFLPSFLFWVALSPYIAGVGIVIFLLFLLF